ncbi:hypothetical protein [Pseudonocardia alaniniphila]|uniref:Secreted protein n=1 Tax=Pseudonocardia alaniniphila TaxID=75291 RepID=A0ABS9T9T1_9PSEU|nr:hypothetical protein [Pseudonocardia alaniniphila]MCH6165178.1 hypothetical protein [Pseudonocardia alaniniphila]
MGILFCSRTGTTTAGASLAGNHLLPDDHQHPDDPYCSYNRNDRFHFPGYRHVRRGQLAAAAR